MSDEIEPEVEPENEGRSEDARIYRSVEVPGSGLLYRFANGSQGAMANEIGQAYARRQSTDDRARRRGLKLEHILSIFGIFSSSMDVASAALAMPTPIPNRVTHRITFKNDADIILIPGQINMPNRYYYNSGTTILFPGEVCTCVVTYQQSSHNLTDRLSFSFGAISTDEKILPDTIPSDQADVFPFEIWIGRTATRTTLTRVEGYLGNAHDIFGIDTNALIDTFNRLQYVGFRGRASTTMPSFGIATVDVRTASETTQTMSTQITFTPLDLRS